MHWHEERDTETHEFRHRTWDHEDESPEWDVQTHLWNLIQRNRSEPMNISAFGEQENDELPFPAFSGKIDHA